MNIKEEIKKKIADIKLLFKDLESEPKPETIETKDGKTLSFTGELKEGVEIKCADAAIEDGTHELKDGRKLTSKEGKFVSIELKKIETSTDPMTETKEELTALKVQFAAQSEELKAVKADFSKVMESQKLMLAGIESIAENMEAEDKKPKGGNEEGMTKAEWVVEQAKRRAQA